MKTLRSVLEPLQGQHTIEIVYQSETKLRKGNPFQSNLTKVAMYKGVIGKSQHQAEVDAIRERGTHLVLDPVQTRKWGEPIEGTCLISHKDKIYMACTEVDEAAVTYQNADGQELTMDEVTPWLYAKNEIVRHRDFDLSKISFLSIDGQPTWVSE